MGDEDSGVNARDDQEKELIRHGRDVRLSVSTMPLFHQLHGLHPGEVFWKWVAPGDEHQFETHFFQENYYDIPLAIADDLDKALISWIGGSPLGEVRKAIDDIIQDVRCLPVEDEHRPLKPSAVLDPEDLEEVSFKKMLLEDLGDFREMVVDESSRQRVVQIIEILRNILYPKISGPGSGGKPMGRG